MVKHSSEEIKKRAKPLIDLLVEKGHPHMSIIVNENHIKVVEDVVSIPIKEND